MVVLCNFLVKPRGALQPGELIRLRGLDTHPLSLVVQASSTTELSCIMLERSGVRPAFSVLRPQDDYVCSFGLSWAWEVLSEPDQIARNGFSAAFGNIVVDDESVFLVGRIPSGFGDPIYFDLNALCQVESPKRRAVVARKWRIWARIQEVGTPVGFPCWKWMEPRERRRIRYNADDGKQVVSQRRRASRPLTRQTPPWR